MINAFNDVFGTCKPFAITGSLPCIRELQDEGYDVQVSKCEMQRVRMCNVVSGRVESRRRLSDFCYAS